MDDELLPPPQLAPPVDVPAVDVRRTRAVCYWMVLLFNIPMWAFLPAMLQYINDRRCQAMQMEGHCDSDDVNASAARYQNLVFALPCNIPNALTALALGTLSDWYGRKPIMLICTVSQCVGSMGAALVLLAELELWWFAPFFFINGLGGASWVFVVLVMAALGDVASGDDERASMFTQVMALFFFCSAVGPVLGGSIEGDTGHILTGLHGGEYQVVFLLFLVSNVLLVLTVLFLYKETLTTPKSNKPMINCGTACTLLVQSTVQPLKLLFRARRLLLMAAVYSFAYLGFSDRSTLISLYAKKEPFNMSSRQLGWFLASIGVARSLAVFAVLPLLLRLGQWLYGSDACGSRKGLLLAARIGMVCAIVFTSCFGLADDQMTLFILATVEGLDGMWDSCLRVLMSQVGSEVGAGEGEVLGVIGFCQVFIGSVAPPLFQNIYAGTLHWLSYFIFLLVAFLTFIALVLTFSLDLEPNNHKEVGQDEDKLTSVDGHTYKQHSSDETTFVPAEPV